MKKHPRWLYPLAVALVLLVGGGFAILRLTSPGRDRQPASPKPARSGPIALGADMVASLPGVPPQLAARPDEGLGEAVTYLGPQPTPDKLRAASQGVNVLVCVMDAARYDHFGYHGYPRPTTPNFDHLARESLIFDQHFSQYTLTTASTTSLLTSLYPATHGVTLVAAGPAAVLQSGIPGRMPFNTRPGTAEGETLRPVELQEAQRAVDRLSASGFRTLFLSSIETASPVMGLGQDFDFVFTPQKHNPDPGLLVSMLAGQLRSKPDERFFAYLHFMPPHDPYEMPERFESLFAGHQPPNHRLGRPAFDEVVAEERSLTTEDVNRYDSNLRWADWGLGQLENLLHELDLLDRTLLIVTADHGEALGEHGYTFHARCPYDEATHVPLLIRFPGKQQPAGRVRALTQTIDVMPTVLDLLSIPQSSAAMQGRSLLPLLAGEVGEVNRYAFTRTGGYLPCYVVRDLHSTLLLYEGGEMRALYDLDSDPGQTRNIAGQRPEQMAELLDVFEAFARSQRLPPLEFLGIEQEKTPTQTVTRELPPEVQEELRNLGYLK